MDTTETPLSPRAFAESCGRIGAEFGEATQGSGNISYVVQTDTGERYFLKTPGLPHDMPACPPFAERVAHLRNAIEIAQIVAGHPACPALLSVVETPLCPVLVYEFRNGESLHAVREQRDSPESAYQRFRALPVDQIVAGLNSVYAVHAALAAHDYVAVDFYDGSLFYDFESSRLSLFDLDYYHRGAFPNTMGRMFGSTRFMAPEEFTHEATINGRTTTFTMGRLAAIFLGDGTLDRAAFRAGDAQHAAMCRACETEPAHRFGDATAFYEAWQRR